MVAGLNALLTAAGGTAGKLIPDEGRVGYAHVVGDRDEMVRVTRQQVKRGADWVKIHVTGSCRTGAASARWDLDELRAVTETAHALDTPTVATAATPSRPALAAEAGVDLVLHASFDDAAVAALVEAGPRWPPRSPSSPTSPTTATLVSRDHPGRPLPRRLRRRPRSSARPTTRVPLLCGPRAGSR